MTPVERVFAAACAMVAYFIVSWIVFITALLIGGRFALTYPSFPWWATIFWWLGLVAFAWYIAFRLAPRYFAKPS